MSMSVGVVIDSYSMVFTGTNVALYSVINEEKVYSWKGMIYMIKKREIFVVGVSKSPGVGNT